MAEKKYVIQEVISVYENESAEGGYDHTEYRDVESMGLFNLMGPYSSVEEAEAGIDELLKSNPFLTYRIDTRYSV